MTTITLGANTYNLVTLPRLRFPAISHSACSMR